MIKRHTDQCQECVIFQEKCNGKTHFEVDTETKSESLIPKCKNKVGSGSCTKSTLQVEAFRSLYQIKCRTGEPTLDAFVGAIIQTSDDAFADALKERGPLIREYQTLQGN